jgi:hypothetical protein
MRKYLAKVQDM